MTRKYSACLAASLAALFAACANVAETRANVAGNQYLACLNAAADEYMTNPAGAEQIATAAHARCWSEWTAYRDQTQASYASSAKTPEEQQLAQDKAEAQLRQFEADARHAVMTRVIQRTYRVPGAQ
jgi:hypothetical protein